MKATFESVQGKLAATKFGVVGMPRAAALDYAAYGITVNGHSGGRSAERGTSECDHLEKSRALRGYRRELTRDFRQKCLAESAALYAD